jgi:hypothetical protein
VASGTRPENFNLGRTFRIKQSACSSAFAWNFSNAFNRTQLPQPKRGCHHRHGRLRHNRLELTKGRILAASESSAADLALPSRSKAPADSAPGLFVGRLTF